MSGAPIEAGHGPGDAPRIKLCGVRRVADAILCAEAGADEIGVVLAPSRRRCVSFDEARAIRAALPSRTALVGVFLDAGLAELIEAVRQVPLSAVQLHGRAPDLAALSALGLPVYRALQVSGPAVLAAEGRPSGYARVLLDGPGTGGSGAAFDWGLAKALRAQGVSPLFVAGGLTPENVAEAVRLSGADGVDVSSGIEGADGFKDTGRVRAFVAAARAALDSRREQDRWS